MKWMSGGTKRQCDRALPCAQALAQRVQMRPKLQAAVGEAQTALGRLLRSQGASDSTVSRDLDTAAAEGVDSGGDDVLDVTDVEQQRQRARQQAEVGLCLSAQQIALLRYWSLSLPLCSVCLSVVLRPSHRRQEADAGARTDPRTRCARPGRGPVGGRADRRVAGRTRGPAAERRDCGEARGGQVGARAGDSCAAANGFVRT
jgi:hypothetical protein